MKGDITSPATDHSLASYLFHQGTNYHAYQYLGMHRTAAGVVFRVWAPGADAISVVGDFCNWDIGIPMQRVTEGGIWELTLTSIDPRPGQAYKFRIRPYRNALNSRYYGEYETIAVKTSASSAASAEISAAEAKSIALADAGVSASSLSFINVSLDMDDGIKVYEIEFTAGDWEYEYEILAATGKIRDRDKDSIWD